MIHPLRHVSSLADDERPEHPPTGQCDNDIQRDQSDLLHFTSTVPYALNVDLGTGKSTEVVRPMPQFYPAEEMAARPK